MIYDINGNPISSGDASGAQWNGKSWYAYGTSLTSTAQGKYVPYVERFSGLVATNKGIPGGAIENSGAIYQALMNNSDGKLNADLITIEVGANDGYVSLGTPLDLENTTFCGSLNVCLKNILMNCKAQVILMDSTRGRYAVGGSLDNPRPLDYTVSGGYTYLQRSEAMRQVADANGIYFIPFGSGLGLGLYREQSGNLYNVDNIHHTNLGGYNLAQGIWGYLKNIPLWYTAIPSN